MQRSTLILLTAVALLAPTRAACGQEMHDGEKWTEVGRDAHIAVSAGSQYKHEGKTVDLVSGDMIIDASTPVVVKTPMALFNLKRGSVAFIKVKPSAERCFILLETATLYFMKHTTSLRAGEEAFLTDHEPTYREIFQDDDIGRRRVRVHKISDERGLALTEFSLVQAIEREPMVFNVIHSRSNYERALKERLLKMAAVLNMVTSRHGQYQSGVH